MTVVSVVGSTGRVGAAVVKHLSEHYDVRPVGRRADGSLRALSDEAARGASVIVNAAGVAHVDVEDDAAIERLRVGNVDLPVALAVAALDQRVGLLHISSSKAASPSASAYAASKAEGEEALVQRFARDFEHAGRPLVILRPPAMLFPPLDAGKLQHLRILCRVPSALVPPIRLPIVSPSTLLHIVDVLVDSMASPDATPGVVRRDIAPGEHGTLRDVALAFREQREISRAPT